LLDNYSRNINYLRLSITDRCNLRCFYCLPRQGWVKLPAREILSYEEMLRLSRVAVQVGIRKIRVTGGEPLVRRGVAPFLEQLHRIRGLEKICLTTNGVLLAEMAADLYRIGLRHINVSLDTLKPERYVEITGSDQLAVVLAGLEKAAALGFHPIKINFVVLRGINEDEVVDFALFSRENPFQVRFIEFMPTVSREKWSSHFLPMSVVRQRLKVLGEPQPVARIATAGPAQIVRLPNYRGELGFIQAVSEHHCPSCNRLRLTADGRLRPCLFQAQEVDLKGPLRWGAGDEELGLIFRKAVALKGLGHRFASPATPLDCRPMVSIGG